MKIKNKMMTIFILATIIPIISIAVYYDYTSHNAMKEKVSILSNRIVEQKKIGLNDRMEFMVKNLHMSVNNQAILDIILNLKNYDPIEVSFKKEELKKYFDTIIYNIKYLDSIVIDVYDYGSLLYGEGCENGKISNNIKYLISNKFKSSNDYDNVLQNKNKPIWISSVVEDDENIYLIKEFKYFMYAKNLGVITFAIDKSMISDYTKSNNIQQGEEYYVIDNNGYEIASREKYQSNYYNDEGEELLSTTNKNGSLESISTIEYKDVFTSSAKLSNDWKLVNIIEKSYLFKDLVNVRRNILVVVFIGIFISIISAWIISKNTASNVSKLIKKFQRVKDGNFGIKKEINTQDEFDELEDDFNNMVKDLDILIKENYIKSIETKRAHLNALQYQINPHFLYNSLEVINSIAATYGAYEIRKISQNLGSMFRYNIDGSGEVTTLSKEIEHIDTYIYLHKLHLPHEIDLIFDIDEKLKNAKLLKFTIQPLVENIIKHGFKNRYTDAYIKISAKLEENLIIKIEDDGCGMEENLLKTINKNLKINNTNGIYDKEKSIGLLNINERIKLFYGENYGIEVSSTLNKGTSILIKMPYID